MKYPLKLLLTVHENFPASAITGTNLDYFLPAGVPIIK